MAALKWASLSSTTSTIVPSSFDVFLNFRGKDTRNNFISFLHKALKDRGINVFVDSEKLWTGEAIDTTLRRAIEGSKILISVFSKGYADSKWCLQELALICQCRSNGQLVLPIFFNVTPSLVQNQTGSFEEAFRKHEKNLKPDIVKGWRESLEMIGNLIGEVVDETTNQAEQVESVVKRVLSELISSTHLTECKYPIGIDSPVNDIESLLNIGTNGVQFVGICGFGGIGKTTIAKAVYDRILVMFNRHSFLSDIREQANQSMGLVSLQKRLLKDIFKIDIDIADYHMGKTLIEQRLYKEKVLVVLDDVDRKEQIDALAGELKWFGPGSRVMVTTRNEEILTMAEDKIYKPQVLDHEQSLQLFSWHAFQNDQPPEEFMQLSRDVAHYSKGLPLTLEVLGSYLANISNKEEWRSTLQTLKEIPHEKVQRSLKISYDNLENDYQKAIFLDAACFFIGWEKETVISVWEACGYHPKSAIERLIKRSLLKFENNEGNEYLKMHDQIRDMGREIVLEESRMELGKHSRFWAHDEICDVLEKQKGTGMIQGMIFPFEAERLICATSEDFEKMSNLKVLHISSKNFEGDFSRLPSSLKWFMWVGHRLGIPPTNFYHNRLVHLIISGTNVKQAWNIRPQNKNKVFQKLKVLELNSCINLSKSPHFSWFPYLERLIIYSCISLDKLDESIGQLSQLKSLNLKFCISLKKLPESIGDLKSLVTLDVTGTLIEELPDSISRLSSLKVLILSECISLKKLPESIGDLKSLVEFKLARGMEIMELPDEYERLHGEELQELVKRPRTLMEMIRCLHGTDLPECSISKIPDDFSMFLNLKQLVLFQCEELEYILELPSSLVGLHCEKCYSLARLPDLSRLKHLTELMLKDCQKLGEIRGLEGTESLEELDTRGCYNLTHNPWKKLTQGITIPGSSKRDKYELSANGGMHFEGLTLWIVFKFPSNLMRSQGLKQGRLPSIYIGIDASICQKDKKIRCRHVLRIEDAEFTDGYISYFYPFKGFDWFGIPLEGKDAIENLIIDAPTSRPDCICRVKFWTLLFKNRDPDQQKPNAEEGKEEMDNEESPSDYTEEEVEEEEPSYNVVEEQEEMEDQEFPPQSTEAEEEEEEIPRSRRTEGEEEDDDKSPSDHNMVEEEEDRDDEESPSDCTEEDEEEIPRFSTRPRHDDNNEGFNLRQMLISQQPKIEENNVHVQGFPSDTEETERRNNGTTDFNSFDWFGIPLLGKDFLDMENLDIHMSDFSIQDFLFENREPNQQKSNQPSGAMAEFFNRSCIDKALTPHKKERKRRMTRTLSRMTNMVEEEEEIDDEESPSDITKEDEVAGPSLNPIIYEGFNLQQMLMSQQPNIEDDDVRRSNRTIDFFFFLFGFLFFVFCFVGM